MPIQYPDPIQVIPVADRSPQDWVDYYLSIEDQVLGGKDVKFDDGRTVVMEDLSQIRRARGEWERRVNQKKRRGRNNFGGLHYKTADLSR